MVFTVTFIAVVIMMIFVVAVVITFIIMMIFVVAMVITFIMMITTIIIMIGTIASGLVSRERVRKESSWANITGTLRLTALIPTGWGEA